MDEAHVQVHMGILVIYLSNSSHLVFSPFWKENFLIGFGRKHLDPTIIFLSTPPYQTLSKKFFSLSLSLSLSLILPKIHFTKHTLKVAILWTWLWLTTLKENILYIEYWKRLFWVQIKSKKREKDFFNPLINYVVK